MTKERRLAIQMWEEIVKKCQSGEDFNVARFKNDFCKEHSLSWANRCYFCQYCRCCSNCPLVSCILIYPKICIEHDVSLAIEVLNALKGLDK